MKPVLFFCPSWSSRPTTLCLNTQEAHSQWMWLVLTLLLKSIWCSQTTTFNSYWLFVTSNMRLYKIYISFLTAVSWCFDPECPEIKSSPHAEQCCLPSGMVTCWWVPPPAAIESGQKRCSGRFWGVFFLAFGVSEELASSMGCRIRLRAFINLETPNTGWFSSGWNVCFVLTGCDENIFTWKSFRLQTCLTLNRDEKDVRCFTH